MLDKAAFKRGLDVQIRDGRQIAALMRVLHELVRTSVQKGSVSPLMDWLYTNFALATKAFASVKIACRRGCSHCCQMWVDASPAEILYVANSLTEQSKAAAAEAVAKAMDKTRHMSFEDRGQFVFPCPMLRNGECSVYSLRPLACRAATSGNVEVCARAYNLLSDEQIPLPLPWMLVGSGYRLALAGALKRAGLTYRAIELNSGLEVALSDPTAERRWLKGENPFASAQQPPVNDIMDNPQYEAIYSAAFA